MVGSHPQLVPMLGLYYYYCAMHPLCGAARQEEQRKSAYTHPELLIDKVSDEIAVDGCKNIWNPNPFIPPPTAVDGVARRLALLYSGLRHAAMATSLYGPPYHHMCGRGAGAGVS